MSDIFISYKREEQLVARTLANALEKKGWSVWWDPKLRAGEHFDNVIEKALTDAKCVIVMWSRLSVESQYVKDEASYALKRKKLVPVTIEEVDLPFRFEGLHTEKLDDWKGSETSPVFQKLVADIASIVGPAPIAAQGEARRKAEAAAKRDRLKDGSQAPEMVVLPAGVFQMGDVQGSGFDDEKPVHKVDVAKPFAMGKYPVTFDDYDRFAQQAGRKLPEDYEWGRENRPVIHVSWDDAVAYTEWLSEQTGRDYRLPTEAEWEYAARAGTETEYWWGDKWKWNMANSNESDSQWGGEQTAPVGSFPANPFGLHDTAGNVNEWVQDCWHENYVGAPTDGLAWLGKGGGDCGRRVFRGGSWFGDPVYLRSSDRFRFYPDYRFYDIGFRLAQDL